MSGFKAVVESWPGQTAGHSELSALPSLYDLLIAASKGIALLEGRSLRHGVRVAVIAGTLGHLLQLPQREQTALIFASLLHDAGLVRIVSDVAIRLPSGMTEKDLFSRHPLLNTGILIESESRPLPETALQLLKAHPQSAAGFLDRLQISGEVAAIIAGGHELMDGSGYPLGISGEAIPISARILAFSDTIEARMDHAGGLHARQEALDSFLNKEACGKFDPELVELFRTLVTTAPEEVFLRQLYTRQAEAMLDELIPQRRQPLAGESLRLTCEALGTLSDNILPLYTRNHSFQTANTALSMACHIGIPPHQTGQLALAGLVHDLGMLAVPMNVLLSPDTLNPQQWSHINDHPRHTMDILKGLPGFEAIREWCGEHHERMNGSGYPGGKKGIDISVAGRILGIADAYSALISPRPYRAHAYEPMDALPILGQGRFRLFDHPLISVLRSVVLESQYVVP